jgi:hypothetical protein
MVPILDGVNVPFFTQFLDEHGVFTPNPSTEKGAAGMMAELKKWTGPLKGMREAG